MNNRVWLDTLALSVREDALQVLKRIIDAGFILVTSNTFVDIKVFQKNSGWAEKALSKGSLVIEIWNGPNEMTSVPFFWSSANIETPAALHFEEAIDALPNKGAILILRNIMDKYGIPKGNWHKKSNHLESLLKSTQKTMGFSETATRTEILDFCKRLHRMATFDDYNKDYCNFLASQHHCSFVLRSSGCIASLDSAL